MTLVIALHGSKGSGKDRFFTAVKTAFPQLDIRKIAYADPIKHEIMRIFNLNSEEEYDRFKRVDLSFNIDTQHTVHGRQVVREIGMLMRSYNEDQFVRYVEHEIQKAPEAIWCITDLRFTNELDSIRNVLNGIVIKIKRNGFGFDGHVTETEFSDDLCDSVIHNVDLSLDQYDSVVVKEMRKILNSLAIQKGI